jgi:hypothetical protein
MKCNGAKRLDARFGRIAETPETTHAVPETAVHAAVVVLIGLALSLGHCNKVTVIRRT